MPRQPFANYRQGGGEVPVPYWLGIDPSLTQTAVFYLGNHGYSWRIHRPKTRGPQRLSEHRQLMREALVPGLSGLAYEGYSFGSKMKREVLGELGGVLRLTLLDQGASAMGIVVPPTVLKKFATGKGNASKGEVISAVEGWGFDVEGNDNLADACVLAHVARAVSTGGSRYDYQSEAVQGLKIGSLND